MQGNSGFLTHEMSLQRQVEKNNALAARFPSVLVDGHRVHIFEADGQWLVWLNTEDMDFSGLCIGVGATRDTAVSQAVKVCEAVEAFLQGPPA